MSNYISDKATVNFLLKEVENGNQDAKEALAKDFLALSSGMIEVKRRYVT